MAALDWGQVQTLTAMGVPLIAAAQIEACNTWVGAPKLPPSTHDVGLRSQPNLELLAQLDPDLITITSMYAGLEPLLIVQFRDARHVRVYAEGSLIDATVSRLGLTNAWHGPTTMWGSALVPLARLAEIKPARMVVVRPMPPRSGFPPRCRR